MMGFVDRRTPTTAVCKDRTATAAMVGDGWKINDTLDAGTKSGRLLLALTADAPAVAFQQNGDITVVAAYPEPVETEIGNNPALERIVRLTGQFSKKMPLAMIVEKAYLAGHEDARTTPPDRRTEHETRTEPVTREENGRKRAPQLKKETIDWFLEGFGRGKDNES